MEVTTMDLTNFTEEHANLTDYFDFLFVYKIYDITIYVQLVICILGIVSNTVALIVLLKSDNLRKKSMGKLLIALSIADNCVLLGKRLYYVELISKNIYM